MAVVSLARTFEGLVVRSTVGGRLAPPCRGAVSAVTPRRDGTQGTVPRNEMIAAAHVP